MTVYKPKPKRDFTCICGCGKTRETSQPNAQFYNDACRNRYHARERRKKIAESKTRR